MSAGYQLMLGQRLGANSPASYTGQSMGATPEKNPKSQLMEFFQKRQGTPQFATNSLSQPPADPSFRFGSLEEVCTRL